MQVANHLRVANRHAQAPAGHVVGFGERVELDGHLFCARNLHDARGHVAIKADVHIRSVVRNENVVLSAKGDRLFQE